MKKIPLILLFIPLSLFSQNKRQLKSISSLIGPIKYIPNGIGSVNYPRYEPYFTLLNGDDSTLLIPPPLDLDIHHSKTFIPEFLIDIFEISRYHYYSVEFENSSLPTSFLDSLSKPNEPVSNISWEEAIKFAKIKQLVINTRLFDLGLDTTIYWVKCNLPSVDQWEKVASPIYDDIWLENEQPRCIYPVPYGYYNNMVRNIHRVYHKNVLIGNFIVPDSTKEVHLMNVGSFRASSRGFYDLSGNVSEWTRDSVSVDTVLNYYRQFYRYILGRPENVVYHRYAKGKMPYDGRFHHEIIKENPDWSIFEAESLKEDSLFVFPRGNNFALLQRMSDIIEVLKYVKTLENQSIASVKRCDSPKIVKGGAYNKHYEYAQTAVSQIYDRKESSSAIGFRLTYEISPAFIRVINKYLKYR
jgi:hypothetical protein